MERMVHYMGVNQATVMRIWKISKEKPNNPQGTPEKKGKIDI
jgi:hypothetical protein